MHGAQGYREVLTEDEGSVPLSRGVCASQRGSPCSSSQGITESLFREMPSTREEKCSADIDV